MINILIYTSHLEFNKYKMQFIGKILNKMRLYINKKSFNNILLLNNHFFLGFSNNFPVFKYFFFLFKHFLF